MAEADDLLRLTRRFHLTPGESYPSRWRPATDVHRTRQGWLVKFELAGVRDEEIELEVHGRYLVLRGRRVDSHMETGSECQSMEIAYTGFERVVQLPRSVEHARLETDYQHGIFLVRIITEASP